MSSINAILTLLSPIDNKFATGQLLKALSDDVDVQHQHSAIGMRPEL